jgi:hypothetical protein
MNKPLPSILTSYDLFKAFAVVTMIADHAGYYFFPDDLWWRVAGRMSAPVWLFLIGYANSRDLSARLWVGAGVLIVASGMLGPTILPASILPVVLAIRLVLDRVLLKMGRGVSDTLEVWCLILLLALPTALMSDYGAVGLAVALYGAYVRRLSEGRVHPRAAILTGVGAYGLYGALMWISFEFSVVQFVAALALSALSFAALYRFRPVSWEAVRLPGPVSGFFKVCGRYSLEIYVLHLVAFKVAALGLGMDGFAWMGWRLFE